MEMTNEEYTMTQLELLNVVLIVKDMDLEGLIARINECETLAPIIDPSRYIRGAKQLENVKRDAINLLKFKKQLQKEKK